MSTTKIIYLSSAPLAFTMFTYWLGGGDFYRHEALAVTFVVGILLSILMIAILVNAKKGI
jgi:uncharacterized membrane protein YciS (DUF1049 family)